MKNTKPKWLFLDFDGVLCDSLEECFRSSWLALAGSSIGPETPPEPSFPAVYRQEFTRCRPFIRSGEDYLVLHQLVQKGVRPADQAEFDRELELVGRAGLDDLKSRLYRVREDLLALHRPLWLSWNPLFPGVAEALRPLADKEKIWILSTKKASFIQEILAYQDIRWPLERIQYSGNERKLGFVEAVTKGEPSELVDDQIDHLDFGHPSCRCHLALWGYVAPGTAGSAASSLTLKQFLAFLEAQSAST